jgi:hypothetical protein
MSIKKAASRVTHARIGTGQSAGIIFQQKNCRSQKILISLNCAVSVKIIGLYNQKHTLLQA